MDGLHLLREPNHPARPTLKACGKGKVPHTHRFQAAAPVKYYFIDFDESVRFASASARHLVTRRGGQDESVPEEDGEEPLDPFKLDIYCIGNLILIHLLNVRPVVDRSWKTIDSSKAYKNLEFIRPLSEIMTRLEPQSRPNAEEVVDMFTVIRESLSPSQLNASPRRVRRYNFVDYIVGDIPARRPSKPLFSHEFLSRLGPWRRRTLSRSRLAAKTDNLDAKHPRLELSALPPSSSTLA